MPIQTKKNVVARRLADIGLLLPSISDLRYNNTAVTSAIKKLIRPEMKERFWSLPLVLVINLIP